MLLNDFYANKGNLITETRTYKLWESAGRKLVEAELTANQINQLFQQVEQGATAAGGNRTMIGKGKDAASAINQAWEDLKTKVQNSGPIKGVDAMYDKAAEQLKQATGGDQGVMKYVQKYRDFAKKHPVAQSLIYSALIAAAGISGAGVGGAAALGLFKLVDKLLQGEKFSSAAYAGAKTGGMAYAAGQIGQALKGGAETGPGMDAKFTDVSKTMPDGTVLPNDSVASNVAKQMDVLKDLGLPKDATYGQVVKAMKAQGYPEDWITGTIQDAGKKATQAVSSAATDAATQAAQGGVAAVRQQASNEALKAVQQAIANGANPGSQSELADVAQSVLEKYSTLQGGPLSVQTAETLAQKIAMQAASKAVKESQTYRKQSVSLSDVVIHQLFEAVVAEGPGWDKFKAGAKQAGAGIANMARGAGTGAMGLAKQAGGAISQGIGNVAGAAMQKAQTVGKNLTTKVTADKLMSAWKKAGSPTDSEAIASVLSKTGVDSGVIDSVYSTMQIPRGASTVDTTSANQAAAPEKPTAPTALTAQTKAPAPTKTGTTAAQTQPTTPATATAPAKPDAGAVSEPAQAPGTSTGGASTMSTITNPETGKLYTKAELRAKYGSSPDAAPAAATTPTEPATAKATATTPPATTTAPAAGKAANPFAYDYAAAAKMAGIKPKQPAPTPDYSKTFSGYGKQTMTVKPTVAKTATPAPAAPAAPTAPKAPAAPAQPAWTGRAGTSPKISAPPKAGAPTADERAKLDQKIQAALAKQAPAPVTESLVWSKNFDPSKSLLRKIRK